MPYKPRNTARKVYQSASIEHRKRKAAPVLAFPGSVPDPAGAVSEWARRCLVIPAGHPRGGATLRDSRLP